MTGKLVSIEEARARIGIGRSKIYEELGAGRLSAVKVGKRTFIREDDLQSYVASLPAAAFGKGAR